MSQLIITPTLSWLLLTIGLILLSLSYYNSVYGQYESFSNYENITLGYKIQYPESWHVSNLPNATITSFNSSDNSVHVIVGKWPTNQTFEQFSSGLIHNITSYTKTMNEVFRETPELITTVETNRTTLSGIDAWKITRTSAEATVYEIWTVKNNYAYGILFGADHVNTMVYWPVFQKMVNSFQFIK